MEQAAIPTSGAGSFASFLASLTTPRKRTDPTWNDDELADDIATLSYAQALKNQARCRPPASQFDPIKDAGLSGSGASDTGALPALRRDTPSPIDRTLKRASITIRLSEPECAQLRLRAAEAGLTVSAYLRSCTLEVESLRTQVKETLAQLRNSTPAGIVPVSSKPPQWRRVWPFSRRGATSTN